MHDSTHFFLSKTEVPQETQFISLHYIRSPPLLSSDPLVKCVVQQVKYLIDYIASKKFMFLDPQFWTLPNSWDHTKVSE